MKFSIITISLNSGKFIENTIQSVIGQDYQGLEYIVVDGGSQDETPSIVRRYAEKDSRIRWISEPDQGISDAMNKGIMIAQGDIIAHLHADDFYPIKNVLSIVADKFSQNKSAQWLTGGSYLVDQCGIKRRKIKVRKYSYNKLTRGNCILHPATFVKKGAFAKAGSFDTSLKYAMDYDMWMRLGAISAPISVDVFLACFRVHKDSVSVARASDMYEEEYAIRKRYLDNGSLTYYYHCMNYQFKKWIDRYFFRKISTLACPWY